MRGKGRLTAEATLSGDGADEKWQLTLYNYDADGRIVKKTIHTESASSVATTIDVTLDRQGMPTWQHTTVGSNNFYHWWEYDARGNLKKTFVNTTNSKPGTADVEYDYNAASLVSNIKYGGSFNSVPYAYNSRDWLKQIGNTATTTYPFSAFYIYQNNGVIESTVYYNKQSPATFDQYKFDHTYDSMNRLLGADYSYYNSGWQTSAAFDLTDLAYDPNGNLLAMKRYRSAGTLIDDLTYQYTAGTNKLSHTDDAIGATGETWDAEDGDSGAFTYDANGSMTVLPAPFSVTSAVYDVRGLVTKAVTGSGTTTYRYNSAGERYWKGGSDYYALDGAVQLGVFTTGGTLQYWNIIAGGRVVGRHESGNRKYYHTDHLGTTRAVVEGTCSGGCTIREARDYDAWGVELAGRTYLSGNAAKEGFTGKERDSETGLDYFGARYYLQSIGRWNAVDPMAAEYSGWSPYNYVMNSPLAFVDPDGKDVDLSDLFKKDPSAVSRIISDLREQTGLDLQYDQSSGLLMNNGVLSDSNISNQLRGLIAEAIASDDVITVSWGETNGGPRDDLTRFTLSPSKIQTNIDNTDSDFDSKTFGIGMSFVHELVHTSIGQQYFNTTDRIYDWEEKGVPPVHEFVNRFRRELDAGRSIHSTLYGVRLNHQQTFSRPMASKSRLRRWFNGNKYTKTRSFDGK